MVPSLDKPYTHLFVLCIKLWPENVAVCVRPVPRVNGKELQNIDGFV